MKRMVTAILLFGMLGSACSRTNPSSSAANPAPEQAAPKKPAPQMQTKLDAMIISKLDVPTESLAKVVDLLRQKSIELDTTETDPAQRGVNIIIQLPASGDLPQINSFSVTDKSLGSVLQQVCTSVNMKLKVDPYAVEIVSADTNTDEMIVKQYKLAVPFDANMTVQEYLQAQGVQFPPGSTAEYFPAQKTMVVRNTRSANDMIEAIVAKKNASGGN